VRCATDITGFGLLGHLGNILAASDVGARIDVASLPVFPRALELAGAGAVSGGTQRNHDASRARWKSDITLPERYLCTDAQTSGGLLLAVAPDRLSDLRRALEAEKTPVQAVIGEILPAEHGLLVARAAEH
jgi:selenide,water dikinase